MKKLLVVGAGSVVLIGILLAVLTWKGTRVAKLCSAPSGNQGKCDQCRPQRR